MDMLESNSENGEMQTILVVENEDMVRMLACDILSSNGYQVLEAEDVNDALEIADAFDGKIDLVLTDMVMPGMNVGELRTRITNANPAASIVYMSGYSYEVIKKREEIASREQFLKKPFPIDKLLGKVRASLSMRD
ncbi:response regulator [Oligoflexia bacterium]|nr:response regulator [Oligoflexia bacterium]